MSVPEGGKPRSISPCTSCMTSSAWAGTAPVNLLNSNGDPTFLRTVLYQYVSRQYIAAPKANWARVVINGESWGIYVNTQQINSEFGKEWFNSPKGARWKVTGS